MAQRQVGAQKSFFNEFEEVNTFLPLSTRQKLCPANKN